MLRNYQKDLIKRVENSQNRKIIMQLPTGAGKTYTFIEIAKNHYAETTKPVLILVHRIELLQQAKRALGELCFCIEAGIKKIPHNFNYYIGMVETTYKRIEKLPEFGLVIIDECHFQNFKKLPFFGDDHNCKVLGVTATPTSLMPLAQYYDELILGPTVEELIKENYLVDCLPYGFASDLVDSQKFKTVKGEFDEKEMQDFYSSEYMVKNVVNGYWDICPGKKTLIFNVNIAHNKAVLEAFQAEGLNVKEIDSTFDKKDRADIIKWFKENDDAILCNVGVLTTGFDEPSIKSVILNRATKSLSLYLQMVGRGARTFENKADFKVLDFGKNVARHGYYSGFFDWNAFFKHGSKLNDGISSGIAPTKECPECHLILHLSAKNCDCGYSFEEAKNNALKEEIEKKLVLLIKQHPILIPTDRIFEIAEERGWKEFAVLHKIAEHLSSYYLKHKQIVTDDFINEKMLENLNLWAEKYNKKVNNWYKETAIKMLHEKINAKYA
jgi:superfamily II DNA or RNA helicase